MKTQQVSGGGKKKKHRHFEYHHHGFHLLSYASLKRVVNPADKMEETAVSDG
ncbi:MAG: hypothetical protein P8013_09780 [Candidatus Sulfobium sp.]